MPAPSATWSVKRVHATYRNRLSLLKEPGSWTAVASGRIVNTLADGSKQIFRAGEIGSGTLNVTEGQPSLSIELPVTDDPDNLPQGGEIVLTVTFSSGGTEVYHLSPLLSWPADPGLDLATLADPALVPAAPSYAIIGIPGGVAELDADGDVIDADGTKIVGGGGTDVEIVRDTIATALVAGSNVTITPNDASDTITIAASGGGGAHPANQVYLSELAGADVAAKVATYVSTYLGQGVTAYKPGLILDTLGAIDTFSTQQQIQHGFTLVGPEWVQDQERAQNPLPNSLRIRSTGGAWLTLPTDPNGAGSSDKRVYGVSLRNLSLDNQASYGLVHPHSTTQLSVFSLHSISSVNGGRILGNSTTKQLLTFGSFSGDWNVNNIQDTAFNVGGSDTWLTPTKFNFDTGNLLPVAKYMAIFGGLSNSFVKNWYVTAEGAAFAQITGGISDNSLHFSDCVIEGRNDNGTEYSPGALARISGGQGRFHHLRSAFAMTAPTTSGRTPADAGVYHLTGGDWTFEGIDYQKASGVAETTPLVYASGSSTVVRVRDVVATGATWTGKPVVQVASGATAYVDDTVDVVADSTSKVISPGRFNQQNKQTGTAYTLVTADAGKVLEMNNASAGAVTFPVLPEGQTGRIRRYGAGAVTFTASGTTLRTRGSLTGINGQYGEVTYTYRTSTEVVISGDLI